MVPRSGEWNDLNAEVMTITNICSTNSLLGYCQHLQLCTEGGGGGGGGEGGGGGLGQGCTWELL